jgi:hypothetical protein
MDWDAISRLIPEVGVLAIVGWFTLKGIMLFKNIVDDLEKRNSDNNKDFIEAINNLSVVVKSSDTYLRDRNGRDSEMHKENIKAIQGIIPTMQKLAETQFETMMKCLKERNLK